MPTPISIVPSFSLSSSRIVGLCICPSILQDLKKNGESNTDDKHVFVDRKERRRNPEDRSYVLFSQKIETTENQ